MSAFLVGHATHPDWQTALALAAAQVDAARAAHDSSAAGPLSLGFVYLTDHYASDADALLAELRQRWPGVAWVGSVGVGVAAGGVEYIDEPALALMLAALPAGRFEVFSGASKLQLADPFTALVHADPATPDLGELVREMADRTTSGYLFGGLVASRSAGTHIANGVWQGGLSGVAFTQDVALISRVTQGCQPVGPTRSVTGCQRNLILELDGQPALPALLQDLGIAELNDTRAALPRLRATLVGLTDPLDDALAVPGKVGGRFGTDTRVRNLIGLDPGRHAVAVADMLQPGMRAAFCQRDAQAARRDLVRICSEIREEVESQAEAAREGARAGAHEPAGDDTLDSAAAGAAAGPANPPLPDARQRIRGAVYISCSSRGGPHFGGPSAELKIIQHALGDVPLVGFFAAGEIARHHLYGYTGVLTVFTSQA